MDEIDFKYGIAFMLYAHLYTKDDLLHIDIEDSSGTTFTSTTVNKGDYPEIIQELEVMSENIKSFSAFIKGLSGMVK